MSTENQIDASLGKDGAKIKLQGDVADRASRGLGDVFKPLVNYLGEIGDAVEHRRNIKKQVRVFNEKALGNALLLAEETAKKHGISVRPVPLKTLAQWAEGASLEDPSADNNLTDMWATLLASAAAGANRNLNLFIDLLKKIDPEHADFLRFLIFEGEAVHWYDAPFEWNEHEMLEHIEAAARKLHASHNLAEMSEYEIVELTNQIFSSFNASPSVLITLGMLFFYDSSERVRPPIGGTWDITTRYDHKRFPEDVVESLISLNILEKIQIERYAPVRSDCELVLWYVRLTSFGCQFLEACLEGKFKNNSPNSD